MKIPQDSDTVSQVAQIIIDRITVEKDAEIERLRMLLDNAWKALKTAKQDALEEAAAMADIVADDELEEEKRTGGQHTAESVARVIAKEIRSLIGKVTA